MIEITSRKTLIDNGPTDECANLVLLSEGYTKDLELRFIAHANRLAQAIKNEPWYERIGRETLNVHAIFCASKDPGTWIPYACPSRPVNTPFKAQFCSGQPSVRAIGGQTDDARAVARRAVPEVTCTGVLLNNPVRGGQAFRDGFFIAAGRREWPQWAIHELGHAMFGLGDEYGGKGNVHGMPEPPRPNITLETDPKKVKWRHLFSPDIALPTLIYDMQPRTPTERYGVGLFEGGGHRDRGVWRPSWTCRMRDYEADFCAVCEEHIVKTLAKWAKVPPAEPDEPKEPEEPTKREQIAVTIGKATKEFEPNVAGTYVAQRWMLETLFG